MSLHPDVMMFVFSAVRDGKMSAEIADGLYRAAWAAGVSSTPHPAQTVTVGATASGVRSGIATEPPVAPTKIELQREASRQRQQRKRNAERAARAQGDLFPITLASVTLPRDSVTARVTGEPVVSKEKSPQTPLKENNTSRGSVRSRGTHLPQDWKPSEVDIAYAHQRGLTAERIEFEGERFRNWGTSVSGKNALKRDWSHAWRNWVLRTIGPPPHQSFPSTPKIVNLENTYVPYAQVRNDGPKTDWQSRRDNWHAARAKLAATVATYGGS